MKSLGLVSCMASVLLSACATSPVASSSYSPPASAPADNQVVTLQADTPAPAFKAGRFALQIDTQPPQS
ncbi:MAG: hypothetical protein ACKOXN_02955, partial [Limnohabitans sp.]